MPNGAVGCQRMFTLIGPDMEKGLSPVPGQAYAFNLFAFGQTFLDLFPSGQAIGHERFLACQSVGLTHFREGVIDHHQTGQEPGGEQETEHRSQYAVDSQRYLMPFSHCYSILLMYHKV